MAGILTDYGIFVYQDAVTGQYRFKALRAGETPEVISGDLINDLDTEQVVSHNVLAPDKIVYSFLEAARSFQTSTILISDDGNAKLSGDPNMKKQSIATVTDIRSASVVAARMDQGNNTKEGIRLKVSSDLIALEVGSLLTIPTIDGVYRLASKKANPGDSEIDIALTRDIYATENNFSLFETTGISVPLPLVPDVSVVAVEANRFLHPNTAGYYLIRARGATHIPFAALYRSIDDVEYSSSASLRYQTACTIDLELSDTTGGFVSSLLVTEIGADFDDFWAVVNLSDGEWRAGAVCILLGNEYLFPKSITSLGSGSYTLNDVIRGRLGTAIETHAADSVASLFYRNSTPLVLDDTLTSGDSLYLKTRTYSSVEVMPLEASTPITLAYAGGGYRPLPCENLNTSEDIPAWEAGDDIDLRWDYKNASAQAGAGIGLTGEASSIPLPEGYFTLKFLTAGDVLKRTETVLIPTYTYTNIDLVTDFGGEPASFKVQVVEELNGLTSLEEETTFTQV